MVIFVPNWESCSREQAEHMTCLVLVPSQTFQTICGLAFEPLLWTPHGRKPVVHGRRILQPFVYTSDGARLSGRIFPIRYEQTEFRSPLFELNYCKVD